MNNTTLPQESAASLDSPGFMAYAILLVVITLLGGVVIAFTLFALTMARSIPQLLRIFLINLLLAGLVVAVGIIITVLTSAVLVAVGPEQHRPPLYLCRVYLWVYGTGVVARLWNLAAFSFFVFAIVRFGKKTISKRYAALVLHILWIAPLLINLFILLPFVYEVQFDDGVACFPDNDNVIIDQARYVFLATWYTFGGLIPLTVSIVVPIVCLCYIKRNIVTDGSQYRKGMAKFSLFLVLGGTINSAAQVLPSLLTLSSAASGVYLSYGFATVSLFPTPIIIIAYLKPVQEQVKKMLTSAMLTKVAKEPERSSSTVGTNKTA